MSEQPKKREVSMGRMLSTGVQKQGKTLLTHLGIATKVSKLY